ncbi:SDR family oxidoreductase [Sphingobacterium sp. lm-10]|uniref:SDR family oxidoreductase n=1 Tax=Sphingobacterium sp. lm-10 TaxID=2944904 RepID=UPI002020FE92|nr:SDR family oxidoreductase [Sphingobacterium sp. lm-10]MCL7988976.1 SDR family oxidoreductase [Sphingobacterium sp. lm-10]
MRILVTGSNGFLGQKLVKRLAAESGYHLFCTSGSPDRISQDISHDFLQADFSDPSALLDTIKSFRPTHIIHTAAISSVDVCEKDPVQCQTVNVDIVRELATVAHAQDIHLTFLSTDFVFDGKQGSYLETDPTTACNAYGQSKIDAEKLLQQSGCRHAILRTILVYGTPNKGSSGRNLVIWAKEALSNKETIRVVSDQWRMPTWVEDLVEACHLAAKQHAEGIYHISGGEMMSIQEVVQEVAHFWNLDQTLITPIRAKEIGQDKNRPRKTGFVLDKAKAELGYTPTAFRTSLKRIDEELNSI